jgi:MFS family permease
MAALAGGVAAALFFTTLYLQVALGYSALQVGAAFAPVTAIVLLVSPVAGHLTNRFGVRTLLVVGCGVTASGLLLLAGVAADGSYLTNVLPGLALVALGNGLAFAPTMIAATNGVAADEQGVASGLLNTAQELGSALGLALLAAVATVAATGAAGTPQAAIAGYRVGFLCAASLVGVALVIAASLAGSRHGAVNGTPEPARA